jgi:hypothetical protein
VGRHEFVAVGRRLQRHPDDRHLRAAVRIDGHQRGVGARADEFACRVVEFHVR